MREFSSQYLDETRRGMWSNRESLASLSLDDRERVLDIGCGNGVLSDVLAEETPQTCSIIGVDADIRLLLELDVQGVLGDASNLPFKDDIADLVACQALLINLQDPASAIREFDRVSSDLIAAIEPNNAEVSVSSSVQIEDVLARRAREAYIAGISTDITLGGEAADLFDEADIQVIDQRTYYHQKTIEPPYTERDYRAGQRKRQGTNLENARETLLSGNLSEEEFEAMKEDWRSMGRTVMEQMDEQRYRRVEIVPFYVTVGKTSSAN
ncbi:MAG: class I SAM-dependent methyltransferase [Halobacteriaceae archaeon]